MTSKLIAELHAAGLSNRQIAIKLPQFGARREPDEKTVRRWAMKDADPKLSDFEALQRLHASIYQMTAA